MDGIGARELAAADERLFEGLYGIYNRSINESKFPDNWKRGQVNAAFRSGVPSERANYRPLIMLNLNSKVLENLVCDSIDYHTAHAGLKAFSYEVGYPTQVRFRLQCYALAKRCQHFCPTNANNVGYKCWDRLATHVGHCWVMLGIAG